MAKLELSWVRKREVTWRGASHKLRRSLSTLTNCIFAFFTCLGIAQTVAAAEITMVDGLAPGQRGILVLGPIEAGDSQKFYDLAQQADRAVVFLESPGGSVEEGLSIGSEIAIRGFTTLVLDGPGCHSICAIIWVSGARRYMSATAEIGVHAAYRMTSTEQGALELSESGMANASIGAYLNTLGLELSAIEYFTAARPEDNLLPITPEIAQFLNIDVYVYEGERLITPSDRPTPRRIVESVTQYMGLSTNCSGLLGVESEYWRERAEATLGQGHSLFGGEVFAELISEEVAKARAALDRDGAISWCLETEAKLRAEGLPTGVTGPSFDCNLASTPTERAICNSQQLWALDLVTANTYFFLRQDVTVGQESELVDGQRSWLQRRNECGDVGECLVERYQSRLFDFGN